MDLGGGGGGSNGSAGGTSWRGASRFAFHTQWPQDKQIKEDKLDRCCEKCTREENSYRLFVADT